MAQQPLHKVCAHIDLDAFYAQVEVRQHPELQGKPLGVVQYNPYGNLETRGPDENRIMNASNGSLIAVSYEARASGVKRNMRGDQARAACPDIQLVQVPTAHGKADLTLYRSEGKRVLDVYSRLAKTERASVDECYLDLTEEAQRRLAASAGVPHMPPSPGQVHVMQEAGFAGAADWWQRPPEQWLPGERLLACAAAAVAELRAAVKEELGYTCSAGIAHTKLMAKLCSGLHKPAQQTVLPASAVPALLGPLPIPCLKGLGGKFGEQVKSELGIETVGELAAMPLPRLESAFGEKDAQWLHALALGVTDDVVEERKLAKSLNCGKTFRGRHSLRDLDSVHTWLLELGGELSDRLQEDREANNRVPQLLTVTISTQLPWAVNQQGAVQAAHDYHATSRSCPMRKLSAAAIAEDAIALVKRWAAEQAAGWGISALFITAGNFVPVPSAASAITRFFKPASAAADGAAAEAAEAGEAGHHSDAGAGKEQAQGHGQQQQEQQDALGPWELDQELEQEERQHRQQQPPRAPHEQQQQRVGPPEAAGPSGSTKHRSSEQQTAQPFDSSALPSSSGAQQPRQFEGQPVDESVLAELPPELQKEIRTQMKVQQMAARMDQRKPGSGSSSKRPASRAATGGGGGSGGGSTALTGTQRIDAFLKGKRPKP